MYQLRSYLLLGLFALLVFVPGISQLPVIDRDEAHFAQASRQMIQSGHYFQIRFQDRTRFQKPPGINWLQVATVKLFDQPNAIWPYRLPSLLGALLSVWLTYFFSRRFISESAARLAAAMLASTLLLVVEAHMAVIDASLLASILLMQGALWIIYEDNTKVCWGAALCFWLAMTYGLLLKGVTPLVGLLTVVTLCLIEKRVNWLSRLHWITGLTLLLLLSLAWILMVNEAEHSNYLMQMIHKDLLPKLKGGHESHGQPPLFHLVILPLTFWPVSLFLWQGGRYAIKHRHEKRIKFLLAWILPTWIFFEIMPTKLPQYVLPTFPAIAILCALAITEIRNTQPADKFLRFLQVLWALLSVGLGVGLTSLPILLGQHVTQGFVLLFVEIDLLTLIAVYFAWKGAFMRACYTILLMALCSYPLIFSRLLPQLKPLWLSANLAPVINNHKISNEKPLLVVGYEEPSLVFNLNTYSVQFTDLNYAEQLMQKDPSRLALIPATAFDGWVVNNKSLSILYRLQGYNYTKGRWLDLMLIGEK